jgi:hypothetical protein
MTKAAKIERVIYKFLIRKQNKRKEDSKQRKKNDVN